ncbi:MAG: calcium/sodium antiporter [Lentisphaeria bacterium]|nr:calcium/sodium antiporter [Lentisphaeria bacterium]
MSTDIFIVNIVLFIIGVYILIKGSDIFVEGAASVARKYGVPDIVIGLTLVSIGTSLPELATDIVAAKAGTPEIAMGVIPGSNIANVLLILSTAVILGKGLNIDQKVFRRDALFMLFSFFVFAGMCYLPPGNWEFSRIDGIILLVLFFGYTYRLLKDREVEDEEDDEAEEQLSLGKSITFILLGGIGVVVGATLMVENVVWFAEKMKVPAEIISVTIVAIGTSLPELAVTVAGVKKGKKNIALGNVIGSNTFNLILVMGVTGVIMPIPVGKEVGYIFIPLMLAVGLFLVLFMRTNWKISVKEGWIMMIAYILFTCLNLYLIFNPIERKIQGNTQIEQTQLDDQVQEK